jgi:hypothetical protein
MRSRLIALGVSVVLLAIGGAAPAFAQSSAVQLANNAADSLASNSSSTIQGATQSQSSSSSCEYGCGGSGQAQSLSQDSSTEQYADSAAYADQNGVNANVPVTISGDGVSVGGYNSGPPTGGGSSSAEQNLDNEADSEASNDATTVQGASQTQTSSSSCTAGCGGSGQVQAAQQEADTDQKADSEAIAKQNGVNANVPVTIGGGKVHGGNSSAKQDLDNEADSEASNEAKTVQLADQSQQSSSDCRYGCGGSGQAQFLNQDADTDQKADSEANAFQNGVNANVPVTIGGGDVYGGNSSAKQDLDNEADSEASNEAKTVQAADQSQSSESECWAGCGGSGQFQALKQDADTNQKAKSEANAFQNGVNANVPVTIGGGDVYGGNSSAKQDLDNEADSEASNEAKTIQVAGQDQDSTSDCGYGCGGSGQSQKLEQDADTYQKADSEANAFQNGVNANVPVTIGGGKVYGGDSSAVQKLDNEADSEASNEALTFQLAGQEQDA